MRLISIDDVAYFAKPVQKIQLLASFGL